MTTSQISAGIYRNLRYLPDSENCMNKVLSLLESREY